MGKWRNWLAQMAYIHEVAGSSPALPTIYWKINMQDYTTGPVV